MLKFLRSKNPIYFLTISWSSIILILLINYNEFSSNKLLWPFDLISYGQSILFFLYFIVLFFTAFRINYIINKSVFLNKTNYVPGMIFILLMLVTGPPNNSILPAIANLFTVLAIENLFKIFRNRSCKIEIFIASCWMIVSLLFFRL